MKNVSEEKLPDWAEWDAQIIADHDAGKFTKLEAAAITADDAGLTDLLIRYVRMGNKMNAVERWVLKRIIRKELQFSSSRVPALYGLIRDVYNEVYTEGNEFTCNDYLRECFEDTQFNCRDIT
jgi:hypothetical protein